MEFDIEELVHEHADALYRFALSRLRDEESAEDLVQETFLAAMKSLANFRGESQVRTYLTGILKNKILDHFKKRKREESYAAVEDLEDSERRSRMLFAADGHWNPDTAPRDWSGRDPAAAAERQAFLEILDQCLKLLNPRMARIFTLRELEHLSNQEICKLLDLTETNVGVILHRARLQLQHCIGRSWIQE